jgi:hypothetical protein
MLNRSWQQLWNNYSVFPAAFAGWSAELQPGAPPDFCLLEVKNDTPTTLSLFSAGEKIG